MNSLRVRLILGFSLVAVIPLAVAMFVLSREVQSTVRDQAAERLGATLAMLQSRLGGDGAELAEKLRILARDPALRRIYLLEPGGGRDLAEYLAEKRFLLGLDFLQVSDARGAVIADASSAPSALGRRDGAPPPLASLPAPLAGSGPTIESLHDVPGLVMAAGAPILYQSDRVGTVSGGVMLDSLFLAGLKQASGVDLALRAPGGRVAASTLGREERSSLPLRSDAARVELAGRRYLSRTLPLPAGIGSTGITGLVSTASADRTIAALRATSLLLGALGLAIAVMLGVVWSLQVSRPVERLARFSQRIAQGHWDEPLVLQSVRELETLVLALDRMRGDLQGYRERLRASERQAAWSQMARKVAHEIKNPLTPIAVSVADLQRSYEQQRPDFPQILDQAVRTIGDEIQTLKRLLQDFSDFGAFPSPRFAPCRTSELAADLRALYGHEIAEGRLVVRDPEGDRSLVADRGQLRQALVNLVKNGLEAVGDAGRVEVALRDCGETLEWTVSDDGPGLSPDQRAQLFVPYFTTKAHGSGLGLTIVERIVSDHQGSITVESEPGRGTTFHVRLPVEREA